MTVYPGLPSPQVEALFDHDQSRSHYGGKAEFHVNLIHMASSTGTYIDVPFHRHRAAADLASVPLEKIAGLPGIVIPAYLTHDGDRAEPYAIHITAPPSDLKGRAVLVATGWDARWGTSKYWDGGPYLSAGTVDVLVQAGAALVGVDFANIDDTRDLSRPAHTRLLAAGVLVVENLTKLTLLPASGFRFFAVPPLVERGASFPVRAFAEITEVEA